MTPLFASSLEAVVFWGGLVLYAAAFALWRVAHSEKKGKRRPELPLQLSLLVILAAIPIGYARIGVLPDWLFYPGEILQVVGTVLTLWSYSILGRYASAYVQVLPDHKVIENGPYRYIRHPGYLGQLLGFLGIGLALQSWVALLAILVVTGPALAYRTRAEEQFLVTELGDSYVSYMKRTKRLVPFVW